MKSNDVVKVSRKIIVQLSLRRRQWQTTSRRTKIRSELNRRSERQGHCLLVLKSLASSQQETRGCASELG